MTRPAISIIIPVYNAAAYIAQCIHSVLDQTMQDIEVIAVNDGSTDTSAAMLDALAANDQRLKVFHNNNKGVSTTRNFGLEQATGTYIAFTDADDWMEPTMLEELYKAITFTNSDWAICNVNLIKEGEQPKKRLNMSDGVIDIASNRAGFVQSLMRFQYDNANWNKLFKASIIHAQKIRFNETMCIGEDLLFNLQYMQFAGRAAILAMTLYNYRFVSTSLYSGQAADRLPQFNLLYKHYLAFAAERTGLSEIEAFKEEMARITYNQLLYHAEVKVKSQHRSFVEVWRGYYRELKRFDPAIFYYPSMEREGIQGIKRQLLQHHQLLLFALIIASKPFLRKAFQYMKSFSKS